MQDDIDIWCQTDLGCVERGVVVKKRPFLMPLALSISGLMLTAVGGNVLSKSLFPGQKTPSFSSKASAGASLDNLVITSASKSTVAAQHSSHGSDRDSDLN
jgi:hypothetical protein